MKSTKYTEEPLKMAFFGAKEYEKVYFDDILAVKGEENFNIEIKYFATKLTEETAYLAAGFEAVCIFVNDDASAKVLNILKAGGVRLLLLRCAGYNNVDMRAAILYGIKVLRVPSYSPHAVAEHAMAIISAANRRIHKAYLRVKDNNFALRGLLGVDLYGKKAGIIGTGQIGRCMARICRGYGMDVIAWDVRPDWELEENGLLKYVTKENLFKEADLISLHAPLVPGEKGTYHLINEEAISLMKDTVMLVNTSRGGLIDTEALIAALKEHKFQAVALDVYEGEDDNVYIDYSDVPICSDITARLMSFPNVIITSHQAFFTREALQEIAEVTLNNARNYQLGLSYGDSEVGRF